MGATGKHHARGKSSASPVARRGGIKEGEGEDGIKGAMEKEDDFGVDHDKPVHRKLRSGRTVYAEVQYISVAPPERNALSTQFVIILSLSPPFLFNNLFTLSLFRPCVL